MLIEPIGLLLALALGSPDTAGHLAALALPATLAVPAEVTFRPRERAVSNWRREAALHLDASPGTAANILLGRDPRAVTRCVRLNNYWCIKRGGWSGEIAADQDGHVAFASAQEGATVAALLLRRYYVDYGRHSARAIVSHWAPAACNAPLVAPNGRRSSADGLAAHGIGRTLRARWLAGHGRRFAGGGRLRGRPSVVPDRLIGAAGPAPVIALGLGAAPVSLSSALPPTLLPGADALPAPGPACGGGDARLAAYAARAADGIAAGPDADLKLFDAAGRPAPGLARLMHNMSAVEIGPLGADQGLVEAAVAHAAGIVAARTAARPPHPGVTAASSPDEARRPEPRP